MGIGVGNMKKAMDKLQQLLASVKAGELQLSDGELQQFAAEMSDGAEELQKLAE